MLGYLAATTSISMRKSRARRGDANRGSCRRLGREVLAIDRVHRLELGEVAQVDRGLDHVGEPESDGFEQPTDVVEHLSGLRLDPAGDRVALARSIADLTGEEDEPVCFDDLAERQAARLDARQVRDAPWHGHSSMAWMCP